METRLDGVILLEPEVHGDARGFMVETYRKDGWTELGIEVEFVQHNHWRSSRDKQDPKLVEVTAHCRFKKQCTFIHFSNNTEKNVWHLVSLQISVLASP